MLAKPTRPPQELASLLYGWRVPKKRTHGHDRDVLGGLGGLGEDTQTDSQRHLVKRLETRQPERHWGPAMGRPGREGGS